MAARNSGMPVPERDEVASTSGKAAERGLIHAPLGLAAGFGFVVASALFAGDLTLRQFAGHSLFAFAAPTGGTLLIVNWLLLVLSAVWPRRT